LGSADHDGHDPQAHLVHEARPQERVVDATRAVLDEVLPRLGFDLPMAPTMSGPRSVAFQVPSFSDREATYLGMALMRSM
jgi:hypothetical protein